MDPAALLTLLQQQHWIDSADAQRLLQEYGNQPHNLFDFLEASGVGSKADVLRVTAEALGAEFVDLDEVEFPPKLFDSVPLDVVRIYRCVPVYDSEEQLKVCLADPLDDVAAKELAAILDRSIKVVVADPELVEAMVQTILEGRSESSSFVDASRTALVAASLGSARPETLSSDAQSAGSRDSRLVLRLSLLAVAAVALAALYLDQKRSLTLAEELRAELEETKRNIEFSDMAAQKELSEIAGQMEKVRQLLEENEVAAIALQQLETGVQRMEGRIEGIEKLNPGNESEDQTRREENASGR